MSSSLFLRTKYLRLPPDPFVDINNINRVKKRVTNRYFLSHRELFVSFLFVLTLLTVYLFCLRMEIDTVTKSKAGKTSVLKYISQTLEETYLQEKGQGCDIPKLEPFAKEMTQFNLPPLKIKCGRPDWVQCYGSKCQITSRRLIKKGVRCIYQDINYINDHLTNISSSTLVKGEEVYNLTESDHIKVTCALKDSVYNRDRGMLHPSWKGTKAGIRNFHRLIPRGREDGINIITIGFDSVSKNMFIRKVRKSYEYLKNELGATFMDGYGILGDGTRAALFPYLSGRTILEFPELYTWYKDSKNLETEDFIFHLAKQDGYRTLFFEDSPHMQTFSTAFLGFRKPPADHYLRPFLISYVPEKEYCVSDQPQFRWMLNLTHQFLSTDGKKFGFTFIVDISHGDYNSVSNVDDDLLRFLRRFKDDGHLKDTMLVVMSDHGSRFAQIRSTYQGRLEERLPLMAIILPEKLIKKRPETLKALKANAGVLTTPFDIYATMLDAMDLRQYWNPYRIKGAELTRSLTLFRPIPENRTCSEAGIEPHFCPCFKWEDLARGDPMYKRAANALVEHINYVTEEVRSLCAVRRLVSIKWVLRHAVNRKLMAMSISNKYFPEYENPTEAAWELYQAKVEVSPAKSLFEGTVKYIKKLDRFVGDSHQTSRTNPYRRQADCIKDKYPHLKKFCYCNT